VPIEHFVTDDVLRAKLQSVLQEWPLYRVLAYTGADLVTLVPTNLSLFCQACRRETFWQTSFSTSGYENNRGGFSGKIYRCRNCGEGETIYYFYWMKEERSTRFFKVGQHPELEERVPRELEGALSSEDLKMYKNALRLRNFNLGIAAVSYMRRVVENRMNDMLDVLREVAQAHNLPPQVLAKHEEIKNQKRFSAKVDYAGDLLPTNLRPEGHPNPMAVLHELASDGLHTKSEEECVETFDECRQTFEYVFGQIRNEAEAAKAFVREIAKLAEKRGKAGQATLANRKG